MQFSGAMFLPVNAAGQVQISPLDFAVVQDLSENARVVAGCVKVQSDSTSTSSSAIGGTLSAAILLDERLDQSSGSTGLVGPFNPNPPALQQLSLVRKDTRMNVPVQQGCVALAGADYNGQFSYVTQLPVANGVQNAIAAVYGPFGVQNNFNTSAASAKTIFLSPYGVLGGLSGGASATNVWVPRLGLDDVPRIRVRYSFGVSAFGLPSIITAFHVFMNTDGNGTVQVQTVNEAHNITPGVANVSLTLGDVSGVIDFAPSVQTDDTVMWVGTIVQGYCTGSAGTATVSIDDITFGGTKAFGPGVYGPTVFIRADNIAVNQQITVSARIGVQYTPGIHAIPFANQNRAFASHSGLALARCLFDGPSPLFKRVWTVEEYEKMCATLSQLSKEKLLAIHSTDPVAVQMINAAL